MTEWRRDSYVISTDCDRLDFDRVHAFLTTSYWSPGISREAVERAARHSLAFGLYSGAEHGRQQVGYARVLSDTVAFAYLLDIFVLEPYRGKGLALWLVETILGHHDLQHVRGWYLRTRDARGLYEKAGFARPSDLERFMYRRGRA
jgi:GNAT superfamily N-acetyltransferase